MAKGKSKPGLNPKQHRFAQEYLVDGNATQAAIRAGYSKASAHVQGCELLKNPKVAAAVKAGQGDQDEETRARRARYRVELDRIALADLGQAYDKEGKLLPLHEMPEDIRRTIAGIESEELWDDVADEETGRMRREHTGTVVKVKSWNKEKALELAMRAEGMLIEKVDHNHKGNVTYSVIDPYAQAGGAKK